MKRLLRRYTPLAVRAITLYAGFWMLAGPTEEVYFERWAMAATTIIGIAMGLFIAGSFVKAEKTELNFSLFWLFLSIAGLFALSIAPNSIGVVWYSAPIEMNRPENPYALWNIPPWLRLGQLIVFDLAMLGVIVEFYNVNWERPTWRFWRFRRKRMVV